jgi:predicted dehydrogenase
MHVMYPASIGIIGAGNISGIYLEADRKFPNLRITKIADVDLSRARAQAEKFGKQAVTVDALLADPEIQLVVNLTPPQAHAPVAMQILEAGKHVYNEKPLAISLEDAQRMMALAASKGLRIGCAPDTFLGGGLQTCRALLDDGAIGQPVLAFARMLSAGVESWHPNPEFFYKPGGGPMFDMGPYYLTALVSLLGPAQRVSGVARITYPERVITSQPLRGARIAVEVPTMVAGLIEFADGAVANIVTTFDICDGSSGYELTIYGSAGALRCPDPNTFGGPVLIKRRGDEDWQPGPIHHRWVENSRGIGVAEMVEAILCNRPHRANALMAYHVLELMHAFHKSARLGRHVSIESTCPRPDSLPATWPETTA